MAAAPSPPGLEIATTVAEVRNRVQAVRRAGGKIGFVPTMGALHAGHASLMQAAAAECDFVIASIFVNPTQFGPQEDFTRYPRTLEADAALCQQAGAHLIFHPASPEIIYPAGFCTSVEVAGLSTMWEGKTRPGHFRGVATVVLKLFNIVAPDLAYFGQKDYQQQAIIRRMIADLELPVTLRVCPIVREPAGLALSSRNAYLTADEHQSALALSQSLELARQQVAGGERHAAVISRQMRELLADTPLVETDYATLADPDTLEEVAEVTSKVVALVAARVGNTRLIDNLLISPPTAT